MPSSLFMIILVETIYLAALSESVCMVILSLVDFLTETHPNDGTPLKKWFST